MLFKTFKTYSITNPRYITLDNATYNDTIIRALSKQL